MKKVILTAPAFLFFLGLICGVLAQDGSAPQDLKALAKSSPAASSTQKSADSDGPTSDRTASPDSSSAQKYYDSGILAYEAGQLDEAVEAFKQAIKLMPDDPQNYYMLGMAHSKSKAYKESFEAFRRATRLKSEWPEAQYRLGVTSYVIGKKSESLEAYNSLLRLRSPLAKSLYRIIEDNNQAGVAESVITASSSINPMEASSGDAPPKSPSTDTSPVASRLPTVSEDLTLTSIYRVGVGDVLDIRLLNSATPRSTLYTVIDGGLIDLTIAGGPIQVAGLTTDEIQARIASELKRRAVENDPRVSVGVRQYASHSVIITGLVNNPGSKFLRREAVPLYVIMAEAQGRLDAGRVTIMRTGSASVTLDLSDQAAFNFMVRPGDIISVTARPQEYYYIGGRINYPGQKVFQPGITLLQAILAAGGLMRKSDNLVELSRESEKGRLATTAFKLKDIKAGKIQDPRLQPGDRVEVR